MAGSAASSTQKLNPTVAFIYHILAYLTLAVIGGVCVFLAVSQGWTHFFAAASACFASLIVLLIDGSKGKWGLKIKGSGGKVKKTEIKAKFILYSTWAFLALLAIWAIALVVGIILGM